MGRFARQLGIVYEQVASDIFKLCEALNFKPTWQQEQLFAAVQRGDLAIAVRSGQGPGKTTASFIVALFRSLQAPGALTILTAPTMRQCTEVWLAEGRRLLSNADPLFQKFIKVTRTKVIIADRPDWGVKTVTATKVENAQGYHQPNMTIIFEEASGIERPLVEQFKGTASNPNCLMLMIGNPNTRDCAFFDCFNHDKANWTCLRWNAEETPESPWFTHERNRKIEEEFGRDSDVYRIRVLGEFPHADPNCVMSSEDVEECMDRKLLYPSMLRLRPNGTLAKQFGQDFARYGGDENTTYRRQGYAVVDYRIFSRTDPSHVVRESFEMQRKALWKDSDCIYVADAGGIGQGVMHMYYEADKRVFEFNNGTPAYNSHEYENLITEGWFGLAKLVRQKQCYMPRDPILITQLAGRQYFTNKKGLLVLESKDDFMKRGHDSPDRADGTVMAFWDLAEATGRVSARAEQHKRVGLVSSGSRS